MDPFATFQKFNTLGDAEGLVLLLRKHNLEVEVKDVSPAVDVTFTMDKMFHEFEVRLRPEDFEKAHQIMEENASELVLDIDPDYYLFDFTDEELMEVVEKEDEWSKSDMLLALKLLQDRGKGLSREEVEEIRQKRIAELRKPAKGDKLWLVIGFASSLLGGFWGIAIGWIRMSSKKTLPNGERVPLYDESTRKSAKTLFGFGMLCLLAWIFLFLFSFN